MSTETPPNQNRENFRLSLLNERKPVHCEIPFKGKMILTTVLDISASGVSISVNSPGIQLGINQAYPACQLNLPDNGKIEVSLYIQYADEMLLPNGESVHRYGCRFIHCPPTSERKISTFIRERERLFLSNRLR